MGDEVLYVAPDGALENLDFPALHAPTRRAMKRML
jgi:hypothetical protein